MDCCSSLLDLWFCLLLSHPCILDNVCFWPFLLLIHTPESALLTPIYFCRSIFLFTALSGWIVVPASSTSGFASSSAIHASLIMFVSGLFYFSSTHPNRHC
uniref:Uncharacterized protein n=1 Tax=Corethron hystrix TaxID=216773 RepID=A0A7S1BH75_9STRA